MTKNILSILFSIFLITNLSAQQSLFFVFLNSNPEKAELNKVKVDSLQSAHMANISKLASEGKLIAAGPFEGGGGIFVLKAENKKKAWSFLNSDPAVKANRFKLELFPFEILKGEVSGATEPYEMVIYQFIRINSENTLSTKTIKENNNIFLEKTKNKEIIIYGLFSKNNDGMIVFKGSAEDANKLINQHPLIKNKQLNFELKQLYIAVGTFGESKNTK